MKAGRYDPAERRRAQRKARERGCSIYISAEELLKAGYSVFEPAPLYRVWGAPRGRIVVQLYRDPQQIGVRSEDAKGTGEA